MASTSMSIHDTPDAAPDTTTSFYQHNTDTSRTSLNERRFHAVNNSHRQQGTTSRSSVSSTGNVLTVDDEIAKGLGEQVEAQEVPNRHDDIGDESSDYNGFLPSRDKNRTHSILPPAAFFAPKKPPHSHSPRSPLSALPSIPPNRPLNASTDDLDTGPVFRRGEPAPMDVAGRERSGMMRGGDGSIEVGSSFALGSGSSSDGHGGPLMASAPASTNMNQTSVEAYRQGAIKGQASRDPLLDNGHMNGDRNMQSSYKSQSATKRPISKAAKGENLTSQTHLSKQDRQQSSRRYKSHQGQNRFFLFGLIMTSDDNPLPFLGSLVIIFALPILWFIFVAPFTWHHISPAPVIIFAYVWAIALSSMFVTAWRDPGVIPRDLDPDPPCTAGEDGKALALKDPLAIPLPRVVRVRNGTDLKVKWCDTCGTYRPPRSSHCRVCDNCVENIDHHCTFLNTCIGRRNYFSFFAFLLASILACLLAIAFSILHIYYLTRPVNSALPGGGFGQGKNFAQALKATPVSAVLFFLAIFVLIPLLTLFSYHVRLVCMNRTTVEQIRINTTSTYSEKPSYDDDANLASNSSRHSCFKMGIPGRDPNPFAHPTIFRNVKTALLRPMAAQSWIDRYHFEQPDTRNINPAHLST